MSKMIDLFRAAGFEDYSRMEPYKAYMPKVKIEILSFDLKEGASNITIAEAYAPQYRRVLSLFYKGESRGYRVSLKGTAKTFLVTKDHIFRCLSTSPGIAGVSTRFLEWKSARDLFPSFIGIDERGETVECFLDEHEESFPVLDVEVENSSCYFSNGVLSHNSYGGTAKVFSAGLKKINPYLSRNLTSTILLNQVRAQIGGMPSYGPQENTHVGGRAVAFYASTRFRVSKMEDILDKQSAIGNTIKIKNVKNKVGIPKRSAELDLYYETGFNPDAEYLDFIINLGIVKKGGAWLSNEEWGMKVCGRDKLFEFLRANPIIFGEAKKKVNEAFSIKTALDEAETELTEAEALEAAIDEIEA